MTSDVDEYSSTESIVSQSSKLSSSYHPTSSSTDEDSEAIAGHAITRLPNRSELNLDPAPPDADADEDTSNFTTSSEDSEEDNALNNNNNTRECRLYIPSFLEAYDIANNWNSKSVIEELKKKDWMPTSLKREVMSLCYKRQGTESTLDNSRDMSGFATSCEKLFPCGRIFASPTQLDQVANMFLKSWGVKKIHPGQSIKCFYSPSVHKKERLTPDQTKRRKVPPSPKSTVKCPFRINYTLVDKGSEKKGKMFHRVKITSTCFEHTCNPSTTSHRIAIERSGCAMPDLVGVQGIVTLLRNKPTLEANVLRPLLKNHIPWFKPSDAKFIANFRRKVLTFILQNPSDVALTQIDVLKLTSKHSAANEPTIEDNPLSRSNLKEILRTIMQDGSDIWDALSLLNKYKSLTPGLDYRVRYHPLTSKPEALCWMLPEMKVDLIRYGNILFLDAQKRDIKRPGWPYIAPCVKDNENTVRVTSECLCISESIENYAWVLSSMASMEPRFKLNMIRIIFADQFLTQALLEELKIEDTCILHGNYYHLLNKVFPETFGSKFNSIRTFLQAMMTSDEDGWHLCYENAMRGLQSYPEKAAALTKIHSNPQYFSSWKVKQIPGNLFCKASTSAEQNHSSVVAHLGKGANLSIAEHINALTERQVHLQKIRRTKNAKRRLQRKSYRSSRAGEQGSNDVAAAKALSGYAFSIYERET